MTKNQARTYLHPDVQVSVDLVLPVEAEGVEEHPFGGGFGDMDHDGWAGLRTDGLMDSFRD